MKNPLKTLDELILNHVFEPITQYANKKLGWTKYDLARLTISTASMGYAGGAFYNSLKYAQEGHSTDLLLAGADSLLAFIFWNYKSKVSQQEERETKLALQSHAVYAPITNPIRLSFFSYGIFLLLGSATNITVDNHAVQDLSDFANLSGGFGVVSLYSASYFKDTTFIPPAGEKKKLWRTLYEGIKSKIPSVKVPQPAEVSSKYGLSEGQK